MVSSKNQGFLEVPLGYDPRCLFLQEFANVWEILRAGGLIMLPLLIMSILSIAIIAERFWALRKAAVLPPALAPEVRQYARTHKMEANHLKELEENSALGAVLAAVLGSRSRSRDVIRQKVEDAGRRAVHELHRFLNALGTIAIIAPLMGLLGTVFGLIKMFMVITESGIGDANKLAGGIGQALIATAAGLVIAIIAYVFHRYFRGCVQSLAIELEREAQELIDSLEAAPAPAPVATPRQAVPAGANVAPRA
jgi:biopolymer transport protein ExbB